MPTFLDQSVALQPLLNRLNQKRPANVEDRLVQAFSLAESAYAGQTHWTGLPLMTHTLTVLESLMKFEPDEDAMIACLLLHVLETKRLTLDEVEQQFGPNIRSLLSGVHLLSHVTMQNRRMSLENLRLMFLRVSDDLRIVLIILCERLLAAEHMSLLPIDEQRRIARDILHLFAPVAARLGIYSLKHSLETRAFPVAYPTDAQHINGQLNRLRSEYRSFLPVTAEQLTRLLRENGVEARIDAREKQPYSIFHKMRSKGISRVDDLYDLYALRVIVKDEGACYQALGVLHRLGHPLPNRFKDFIAFPKPNGYQSLHTTLAQLPGLPGGALVEVQIRTEKMHRESEYGIAAHWSYKEGGSAMQLMKRVELAKVLATQQELDRSARGDVLLKDHIFVLTPKGEVIELPEGATPLDFAFHVHTTLGLSFKAARVNNSIVPMEYELENGDIVEILKHRDPQASARWMSLLRTASARSRLKRYLAEQQRPELIARGRALLNEELVRRKQQPLDSDLSLLRHVDHATLSIAEREELLVKLGQDGQSAASLIPHLMDLPEEVRRLESVLPRTKTVRSKLKIAAKKNSVLLENNMLMPTRFAQCCKADEKKSDRLVGVVSRAGEVRVHSAQCKMLKNGNPERRIKVEWAS